MLPLASTSGRTLTRIRGGALELVPRRARRRLVKLYGQPDIDPLLVVVQPAWPDQFLGRFESLRSCIQAVVLPFDPGKQVLQPRRPQHVFGWRPGQTVEGNGPRFAEAVDQHEHGGEPARTQPHLMRSGRARGLACPHQRRAIPVDHREHLAVQINGLVVGEDPGGAVPCQLQIMGGAVGLAGGGEVASQHGRHLLQSTLGARFQFPGGPAVELAALRAQEAAVGRLTDHGVTETVRALP